MKQQQLQQYWIVKHLSTIKITKLFGGKRKMITGSRNNRGKVCLKCLDTFLCFLHLYIGKKIFWKCIPFFLIILYSERKKSDVRECHSPLFSWSWQTWHDFLMHLTFLCEVCRNCNVMHWRHRQLQHQGLKMPDMVTAVVEFAVFFGERELQMTVRTLWAWSRRS